MATSPTERTWDRQNFSSNYLLPMSLEIYSSICNNKTFRSRFHFVREKVAEENYRSNSYLHKIKHLYKASTYSQIYIPSYKSFPGLSLRESLKHNIIMIS
ncbi:hypothetical protein HanRHA438_Chr09g0379181 [Helianthus annuus]|nr:hypothetical protein HanRHA438_Chr09g0379181 [Helianthus annuus]